MPNKDLISGLFFLVVGMLFSGAALSLPIGTLSNPGPGLVPLFPGVVLTLLSLVLVVRTMAERRKQARERDSSPKAEERIGINPTVMTTLAVMVAYALCIEPLGFVISSVALMLFMFKFGGRLSWVKTILGTALAVGVCHVVFKMWLGVQFPRGPWGF